MKYPARSLTPSLATLPQDVPLCSPRHLLVSIPFPVLSTCKSTACALLNSLASLFATPFLCFQLLADSFAKRGGVGFPFSFSPLATGCADEQKSRSLPAVREPRTRPPPYAAHRF